MSEPNIELFESEEFVIMIDHSYNQALFGYKTGEITPSKYWDMLHYLQMFPKATRKLEPDEQAYRTYYTMFLQYMSKQAANHRLQRAQGVM